MDQTENKPEFDKTKLILPIAIFASALIISGTIIYTKGGIDFGGNPALIGGDQPRENVEVSTDGDPYLGDENAPVTVIEFSDYQCPFCRSFWRDTLPLVKSEYIDTGKVMFVYRDYPLSIHPSALMAANAANCAGEQGLYWEMHDKIFERQDKLGNGTITFGIEDLKNWAGEVGLKQSEFNSCLDSGKYNQEIAEDLNDGGAAGVGGTPTFFINGKLLVGALPFEAFRSLIEQELNK